MSLSSSEKYIREIVDALQHNRAVAMVGSGFSLNAELTGRPGARFLVWNQLATKFYEKLRGEVPSSGDHYLNPMKLAQQVESTFGRPALNDLLMESLPDEEFSPGDIHKAFVSLPWKDIFTTNYDTLLERAIHAAVRDNRCRPYDVVYSPDDLPDCHGAPRLIKLHGSFKPIRPYVITEEDFREYPHKKAAFVNTVQQAMLESVFVMFGFSCDDPNFLQWIGWVRDNLGKNLQRKMYMLCIKQLSEEDVRTLAERNIVPVDLSEFYRVVNHELENGGNDDAPHPPSPWDKGDENPDGDASLPDDPFSPDGSLNGERINVPRLSTGNDGPQGNDDGPQPPCMGLSRRNADSLGRHSPKDIIGFAVTRISELYSEDKRKNDWCPDDFSNEDVSDWLDAYPGWCYMPYEVRYRASAFGRKVFWWDKDGIATIQGEKIVPGTSDLSEWVGKIHQFVRLYDIMGMPLPVLFQHEESNKGILQDMPRCALLLLEGINRKSWEGMEAEDIEKVYRYIQEIYLQLLRAFRERHDKKHFKDCLRWLREFDLSENDIQFIQAECCRYHLSHMQLVTGDGDCWMLHGSLQKQLDSWNLPETDLYWPIIKASFLMQTDRLDEAQALLELNIRNIWMHITREGIDARYAALEQCTLRLLKVLSSLSAKTANKWDTKFASVWRDYPVINLVEEERHYKLAMLKPEKKPYEEKLNFNLTRSVSWHVGGEDVKLNTAAAYWRFQEVTGGFPRFGSTVVADKEAFRCSVRLMLPVISTRCIHQLLLMGEPDYLDDVLGRKQLSSISATVIHEYVRHGAAMLRSIMPCVQESDWHSSWGLAGNAAFVLCHIMSRLCYRASADDLRMLWDLLVDIRISGKLGAIRGADVLTRGVLGCMSREQQAEIYDDALKFPFSLGERRREYVDPLTELKTRDTKVRVSSGQYSTSLGQIRVALEEADDLLEHQRRYQAGRAVERFSALYQLIEMKPDDEELFITTLENWPDAGAGLDSLLISLCDDDDVRNRCWNKVHDNAERALKQIVAGSMSNDILVAVHSSLRHWERIDGKRAALAGDFDLLLKALKELSRDIGNPFSLGMREQLIRDICSLAEMILLNCYKEKDDDSRLESSSVLELVDAVAKILGDRYALTMMCRVLHIGESELLSAEESQQELEYDAADLIDLGDFLFRVFKAGGELWEPMAPEILRALEIVLSILESDKTGINEPAARIWPGVISMGPELGEKFLSRLALKLKRLEQETKVTADDEELTARRKVIVRHFACSTAAAMEKKYPDKYQDVVQIWKDVNKNEQEMAEVRLIRFK